MGRSEGWDEKTDGDQDGDDNKKKKAPFQDHKKTPKKLDQKHLVIDRNLLVEINNHDGKIKFVSEAIPPSIINVEDLISLPFKGGISLIRAGFKLLGKPVAIIAAEDAAKTGGVIITETEWS